MCNNQYYLAPGTLVRVNGKYGVIIGGEENTLGKNVRRKSGKFQIFFGAEEDKDGNIVYKKGTYKIDENAVMNTEAISRNCEELKELHKEYGKYVQEQLKGK